MGCMRLLLLAFLKNKRIFFGCGSRKWSGRWAWFRGRLICIARGIYGVIAGTFVTERLLSQSRALCYPSAANLWWVSKNTYIYISTHSCQVVKRIVNRPGCVWFFTTLSSRIDTLFVWRMPSSFSPAVKVWQSCAVCVQSCTSEALCWHFWFSMDTAEEGGWTVGCVLS